MWGTEPLVTGMICVEGFKWLGETFPCDPKIVGVTLGPGETAVGLARTDAVEEAGL